MTCKIEQCDKPGEYIRGMCPMHYQRWRLRGDPLWEPKPLATPEERFWSAVEKSDDCWTWKRALNHVRGGYGCFNAGGRKMIGAHRFSWTLHYGPIPEGLFVLHRCDNPPCVRPDHLFLGTHAENMADMEAKGRRPVGERAYQAKLTDADVVAIRNAADAGERHADIAKRYGTGRSHISQIAGGTTWTHIPKKARTRGEKVFPSSKLSESQVLEIRAARSLGQTQREIAERFGISRSAVGLIVTGKQWAYLLPGGVNA